jgi:hypothetical protein
MIGEAAVDCDASSATGRTEQFFAAFAGCTFATTYPRIDYPAITNLYVLSIRAYSYNFSKYLMTQHHALSANFKLLVVAKIKNTIMHVYIGVAYTASDCFNQHLGTLRDGRLGLYCYQSRAGRSRLI